MSGNSKNIYDKLKADYARVLLPNTSYSETMQFFSDLLYHFKEMQLQLQNNTCLKEDICDVTVVINFFLLFTEAFLVFGAIHEARESGKVAIYYCNEIKSNALVDQAKSNIRKAIVVDQTLKKCASLVPSFSKLTRAASKRLLIEIDRSLLLSPYSIQGLKLRALLLLATSQFNSLQEFYNDNKFTFFDPSLVISLARSFEYSGSLEEAVKILKKAQTISIKSKDLIKIEIFRIQEILRILKKANKYYHEGHPDIAIKCYTQMIDKSEKNYKLQSIIHYQRSLCYLSIDNIKDAINELKYSLKLDSTNEDAKNQLNHTEKMQSVEKHTTQSKYRNHSNKKVSMDILFEGRNVLPYEDNFVCKKKINPHNNNIKEEHRKNLKESALNRHKNIPPMLFASLGIGCNSNIFEIKQAYHRLALKYHPDKSNDINAEKKFKEINSAYSAIMTIYSHTKSNDT